MEIKIKTSEFEITIDNLADAVWVIGHLVDGNAKHLSLKTQARELERKNMELREEVKKLKESAKQDNTPVPALNGESESL